MKQNTFNYRSIKTFEDACKHLGLDAHAFSLIYEDVPDHVISYMKLEIITRALNNGWQNSLRSDEYSYYNYCFTLTDSEAEDWDWTNRVKINYQRPDGSCGLAYPYSNNGWSVSNATVGSRLAYRSRELAFYSLETFSLLWESFWFPQKWHREAQDGIENYRMAMKYAKG